MSRPSSNLVRVVLGTGQLTIARAIGQNFFLDKVWEVELIKFSEEKKKKNVVGSKTHTHSFDGPVQLPPRHRYRVLFKPLLYYTATSSFSSLLALTSPNPNPSPSPNYH